MPAAKQAVGLTTLSDPSLFVACIPAIPLAFCRLTSEYTPPILVPRLVLWHGCAMMRCGGS